MVDHAPPQVRQDPAPDNDTDQMSYMSQYASGESGGMSSMDGMTPAYAMDPATQVCEAPQAIEQQLSDTSAPLTDTGQTPASEMSAPRDQRIASAPDARLQSTLAEPTMSLLSDAPQTLPADELSETRRPATQGARGTGRSVRRRRPAGGAGAGTAPEEDALKPLGPIAHPTLEFAAEDALPGVQNTMRADLPDPPMATAPDISVEEEAERAKLQAARSHADAQYRSLRNRVSAAHNARIASQVQAAQAIMAAHAAARAAQQQAGRETDSSIEQDALAADGAIQLVAQTARETIARQYRRARRRVGGAKSSALATLRQADSAARTTISTLATEYAGVFAAEVETFATECDYAERFAVTQMTAFIRGIDAEALGTASEGAGERMIATETRKAHTKPETERLKTGLQRTGAALQLRLNATRNDALTTMPPPLVSQLGTSASATKTQITENINTAAQSAYDAVRRQRKQALEAIDKQENEARHSVRTQRDVARTTLEGQVNATSAQSRSQAQSALTALDAAAASGTPALEAAMQQLRGTLSKSALAPAKSLNAVTKEAVVGVGESMRIADLAQRQQQEIVRSGATSGIAQASDKATEQRRTFAEGARERLRMMPTTTAASMGKTTASTEKGNIAAAKSVAKIGDGIAKTYETFMGQPGADGSGDSVRDQVKKAENDNLPAYSQSIMNATRPFRDSTLPFADVVTHPAVARKHQSEYDKSLAHARSKRGDLKGALEKFDSCAFFNLSEAEAVPATVRGLSKGQAREVLDDPRYNYISWVQRSLGTTQNGRATLLWLQGQRVEAAAMELQAARGVFDDNEARAEAALRVLSPAELREMATSRSYDVSRGREAARSYLGGTDLDVVNALMQGNYARADAIRFVEGMSQAANTRTFGARTTFVQRYTGAAADNQWGGQQVNEADRRQQVAREVARLRNPNATEPVSDQAALGIMADVASGTVRYQTRGRDGTTTEREFSRYQGAQNDLLRDSVLHGNTSSEVRAARVGIAIESNPRRPADMTSLELGLVDERLNPNNYPPGMQVPPAVRRQAMADRERMFQLAHERYGGENMSTGDAAAAQARIREQLVQRMGRNKVAAGLVEGMVDEPWPSPETAALAWEYGLQNSTDRSNLIFRFSGRMSQSEIDQARIAYRNNTKRDVYDDLGIYSRGPGAFSGQERLRAERVFRGMARTDQEKALATIYALRQQLRETGAVGRSRADQTATGQDLAHEITRLEGALGPVSFNREGRTTFTDPNSVFDENGQFAGDPMDAARFRAGLAGANSTAKAYQGLIDHYAAQASMAITAIGVIAAVAVTIATGGAAAPLLMAAIAAGAGLAGMAAKRMIRGGGYGWEEAGIDLAMTALDALTAGVGQKLGLASRGGAAAMRAASGATVRQQMTGVANRTIMRTMSARGLQQGAQLTSSAIGDKLLIGAVTGGMNGLGRTALDSNTWREGAEQGSFSRLIEGTLVGAGTGVISSAVSHGIESVPMAGAAPGLFGSGVMSGLSNAGGGFTSTAAQLLYDHERGRYRGDFGAGFLQALQEGGKGGLQGFVEGIGSKAISDHDERRVQADPDLNEMPGLQIRDEPRRPAQMPDAEPDPVNPPIAEMADTPAPNAPGPVPRDADGLPRVPGLGEGTASAIEGSLMRGDFSADPILDQTHVTGALRVLGEPGGVFGQALRQAPGDSPMTRAIDTGVNGAEPIPIRIRVTDPGDGNPPAVARFLDAPDGKGMIIEVSNRAHPLVVERALAHEISEIRSLARDRAANDSGGPHAGGAARQKLDPHERGRLAEFEVLARQIAGENNPDRLQLLQQEAHHLAMDLVRLGGDADGALRVKLLGDAMETPQGRALLETTHQNAADNPFMRPLDGSDIQQFEVFQERLRIAQSIDAVLGGDARARAVLDQAMYVDGVLTFKKVIGISGFSTKRLLRAAPHLLPVLSALADHVMAMRFATIPRPGLPRRPSRYRNNAEFAEVSGLTFDAKRPLASHALDGLGLDSNIKTLGQLVAARDHHHQTVRDLDALIKAAPSTMSQAAMASLVSDRKQASTLRRNASEALGEVAARRVAETMESQLGGPLRELTVRGRGSQMTDLVFEVTSGPNIGRLIVIEAKGGRSGLIYRMNRSKSAEVEQGTREYLRTIADSMSRSSHPENVAVGKRIATELDSRSPNVEYHHVGQKIDDGATTLPLPRHARFDINARPRVPPGGWGDDSGGTAAAIQGSDRFHATSGMKKTPEVVTEHVRAGVDWMQRDGFGVGRFVDLAPQQGSGAETRLQLHLGNDAAADITIQPRSVAELEALARAHGIDQSKGLPPAFFTAPDANGARTIYLSDTLDWMSIPRAIAHELTEIRAIYTKNTNPLDALTESASPLTFNTDGSPNLSPHDHGRLAEVELLTRQIAMSQDRGSLQTTKMLQDELGVLALRLGALGQGDAGRQRKQLLFDLIAPISQVAALDTFGSVPDGLQFQYAQFPQRRAPIADLTSAQRNALRGDQSSVARRYLQDRLNIEGLGIDPTVLQAGLRANAAEVAARTLFAPTAALADRNAARGTLLREYPQLLQAMDGDAHPGHLRDAAVALGLPEETAFDLHRAIRIAQNGQDMPSARRSLEVFLWDIYHNRRHFDRGDPYDIYKEYAISRQTGSWSETGMSDYRTGAVNFSDAFHIGKIDKNPLFARFQPSRSGGETITAEDNFHFLKAHTVNREGETFERLYLRMDPDGIFPFFEWFATEVMKNPGDYPGINSAKIVGPAQAHNRSESMVIYLTKQADTARLSLLLYQKGRGILRQGVGAVTPMTETVMPGIQRADAPSTEMADLQRKQRETLNINNRKAERQSKSFGQTRVAPIAEVLRQGRPDSYEAFLAKAEQTLEAWGIDPKDPSRESQALEHLKEQAAREKTMSDMRAGNSDD